MPRSDFFLQICFKHLFFDATICYVSLLGVFYSMQGSLELQSLRALASYTAVVRHLSRLLRSEGRVMSRDVGL